MTKSLIIILTAILFVFSISEISAQSYEDVVYLNDGSIIRGKIIEQKKGEYVKIKSCGNNIWVFKSENIDKIAQEETSVQNKKLDFRTKGYYNITGIGILSGRDTYQNKFSLSVTTINGYQHKQFYVGLGMGVEFLDIALFPVFIDMRYNLLKGRFTPFVAFQGGYALPLENNYEQRYRPHYQGGYLLNPVVGIRNYFSNDAAIVISIGYRHQQLKAIRDNYDWLTGGNITTEITTYYNRAYISFAFLFN